MESEQREQKDDWGAQFWEGDWCWLSEVEHLLEGGDLKLSEKFRKCDWRSEGDANNQ